MSNSFDEADDHWFQVLTAKIRARSLASGVPVSASVGRTWRPTARMSFVATLVAGRSFGSDRPQAYTSAMPVWMPLLVSGTVA